MRRLLTPIIFASMISASADANEPALQLNLGGFISGYAIYTNQDETPGNNWRQFDFRKAGEVYLDSEVVLDNGITAGAAFVILSDRFEDEAIIEESYLYLSGEWGRMNLGETSGSAFLLQVAAPSADDWIDGIQPDIGTFVGFNNGLGSADSAIDYAHDDSSYANKLTYITPAFNGLQGGISYTPAIEETLTSGGVSIDGDGAKDGLASAASDNDIGHYQDLWEVAVRYEGSLDVIDVAMGAGYSYADVENTDNGFFKDLQTWNIGADIDWDAFGIGAAYITTDNGIDTTSVGSPDHSRIWVIGIDYTAGPYKFGASYLDFSTDGEAFDIDTEEQRGRRWTVGIIYEWGPAMTLRGSVQHQQMDNVEGVAAQDGDGTQFALGTVLEF